jgi:tetratricopeptide (TPR) repeat protein
LKNTFAHKIALLLLVILISSCSANKNTWLSREYQALNTSYNVYFNGYISYNDGLRNIVKANKEDYSTIIPMYPISRHSNASAATSDMDRTIEKCRKAIKLHSIKAKPKKDLRKESLPEYKLYYNQSEFNPALKEAWLLLAKAEFHKADFLGSVGTFSYIIRHYSADKEIEAICQLWIVRAYGEMGWIYEAEQVLSKLKQDNIKRSETGLFASVNADLLLKKHQYKAAMPFLELALANENNKDMKLRFSYLLAQLYQKTNDNKAAFEAYAKVIKQNPPYEMDFNARISQVQLNVGNVVNTRKELHKMLKNSNNNDYLDQLYYALGNTYLYKNDTAKAIDNYKLSVEKSKRNGIDKAVTLVKLGDIYYEKRKYVLAQPCYDDASKILTDENEDFARVSKRAETLSELVTQNDIVTLQDSLQALAALPEAKRLEIVDNVIKKLIADEKAAAEKAKAENEQRLRNPGGNGDLTGPPIGMNSMGGWYFYNPEIVRAGQDDFLKKWGKRKLEDNWRRTNKSMSLFAEENADSTTTVKDSTTLKKEKGLADNKKPEFYLSQIPMSQAQIAKSNAEIATALFSMGEIYKDKVEDLPLAISTFEQFIRRFGKDERVADAYFDIYLIQKKLGNDIEAERIRNVLITIFPNSKYHKILSQPDYAERLERMYHDQDSVYSLTYKAYNDSKFDEVFSRVAYIQKNYPLSTLMPKFLFLNALSIGKTDVQDKFRSALDSLVVNYPQSDVTAIAKDILALMKQGGKAQTGTSHGSLLALRDEVEKSDIKEQSEAQFTIDKLSRHRLLLVCVADQANMNQLQYEIASFNFSRFMIKDFDLVINKLDSTRNTLSITNFDSYDDANSYLNSVNSDLALTKLMNDLKVRKVIISEDNYALVRTSSSLENYQAFLLKPVVNKPKAIPVVAAKQNKQETMVAIIAPKGTNAITNQALDTKTPEKPIEKSRETVATNKPAEAKPTGKPVQKPEEVATQPVQTPKPDAKPTAAITAPVVAQPKQEDVPLFKGLFAYRANEPHYIAIYVLSGTIDFEKIKSAYEAYNKQNYAGQNLKLSLEKVDKIQVIIFGSFNDATTAKSYLLRMVKEKTLFEGLKGATYRNLLGSQKNLNTVIQQNALNTYFEFMQQYYLK